MEYGNTVKLSVERFFFVLLICRYGTHVEFTIVNLCVMCGCSTRTVETISYRSLDFSENF